MSTFIHPLNWCNEDIQLSKSLSWLLRHGAVKEGVKISPEGYILVDDVLKHRSFKGKYSQIDVERVVRNNSKQRFKLRQNPLTKSLEIKATQGHSITQVNNTELIPVLEAKYQTVVHGTYLKYWSSIKGRGLHRMKRNHIHLAKGLLGDAGVASGLRKDVEVYIFVDLEKALADGLVFYESDNGVILTEGDEYGYLAPKYFSKVVEVHTGKQLHP